MSTDLIPARLPDADLTLNRLELVAGERQYVTNPHLWQLIGAAVLLLGSAAGTAWSVYRDYTRADLAFAAVLACAAWVVACTRRFNAWDQA